MDVMLQRHCARYIYIVPEGLRELMSDISREVLRSQPNNIYTFIADYLDALMITRENARVAARLVQNIQEVSETIVAFLTRTSLSREEADRIAAIIQTAFRNYLDKKHETKDDETEFVNNIIEEAEITPEEAEEAALIIQTAFRNFKIRKNREKILLAGIIDWRVAARSAIKLYRKTGVSHEEANRAATLIKAAYKGYYTRRIIKRLFEEAATEVGEEEEEEEDDEFRSKRKSVRINFETVKPRVDFEDATVISDDAGSAIVAAKTILESIINKVTPEELTVVNQETLPSEPAKETAEFVRELIIKEILPPIFEVEELKMDEDLETTPLEETVEPVAVLEQETEPGENAVKPETDGAVAEVAYQTEQAGQTTEATEDLTGKINEVTGDTSEAPEVAGDLTGEINEVTGDTSEAPGDSGAETTSPDYTETETDFTDTPRTAETTDTTTGD